MTFHTEHVNYVNGAFFPLNFCWTAIFVSSSVAAETIPGREGVRPSSAVILNEDYSGNFKSAFKQILCVV